MLCRSFLSNIESPFIISNSSLLLILIHLIAAQVHFSSHCSI